MGVAGLEMQRTPPQHVVCRKGGGIAVRERQIQLRKIADKLQENSQTSRSVMDQHLCTGDTQGTNKHAMRTSKKQLRKNLRKIPENFGKLRNCEKLQKLRTLIAPPPPPVCRGTQASAQTTARNNGTKHPRTCTGQLIQETVAVPPPNVAMHRGLNHKQAPHESRYPGMHCKEGPPPPPAGPPSLCPATVPPTASAGFNGICNRQ